MNHLVSDAVGMADALGRERFHLVGHDCGGAVLPVCGQGWLFWMLLGRKQVYRSLKRMVRVIYHGERAGWTDDWYCKSKWLIDQLIYSRSHRPYLTHYIASVEKKDWSRSSGSANSNE